MSLKFYTIDDLENLPPPRWLIDDLFEQDALVMLVGPPGSLKSFLAIDWCLSIATGRKWNGRATVPSKVLYALGEGKRSLLKRIKSWICYNNLSKEEMAQLKENFLVIFDVPQLAIPHDARKFEKILDELDFKPSLLVIDTLARSYVNKSENDPMDTGVWVDTVDRLRKRDMTVMVIHHTKKNVEAGLLYRGTTAWLGAMDASFTLERSPEGFKGLAKLKCDKQKDHQETADIWMKWQVIKPNSNTEGSIVLIEVPTPTESKEEEAEQREEGLQVMIDMLLEDKNFDSDRARARILAQKSGILETTAHSKIARARKRLE